MGEDLSGAMQMSRTPVVHTGAEFRPQHLSDRQLANARLQVEETIGNSTILPPTLYNRQFFSRTGLPIEAMDGNFRSRLEMGVDLAGSTQVALAPDVHRGREFRPQPHSNRQASARSRWQVEDMIGNFRNRFALQDHNYVARPPAQSAVAAETAAETAAQTAAQTAAETAAQSGAQSGAQTGTEAGAQTRQT